MNYLNNVFHGQLDFKIEFSKELTKTVTFQNNYAMCILYHLKAKKWLIYENFFNFFFEILYIYVK